MNQKCQKKTSNWLQGVSGGRELFNSLSIFSIGLFNLFNYFTDPSATDGLLFAGILISIAAIIFLCPFRKSVLACLFLLLALIVHKDMTDPFGFSSASLFVLAYYNIRNKGFGITVVLFTALIIVFKSTEFNDNPSQVVMTIILYAFLYTNFYKIFKAFSPVNIKALTKEQNALLDLIVYHDLSQKEAGAKMGLNQNETNDLLKQARKTLNVTSLYSVIRIVSESKNRK